jgi:hypothetical protein
MKHLKHLLAVVLLVLTLGVSAYAGDIQMPGLTDPPQALASCPISGTETSSNDGASATFGFNESVINLLISAISMF